jgi:hypothetical protein
MINFTAISHNVLAAVGALILSTTFVAAAVGQAPKPAQGEAGSGDSQ